MDDHPASTGDHAGDEGAIKPDRRQQIHIKDVLLEVIGERLKPSGRRIAGAEVVDEDIDASPVRLNPAYDGCDADYRAKVSFDPHRTLRSRSAGAGIWR